MPNIHEGTSNLKYAAASLHSSQNCAFFKGSLVILWISWYRCCVHKHLKSDDYLLDIYDSVSCTGWEAPPIITPGHQHWSDIPLHHQIYVSVLGRIADQDLSSSSSAWLMSSSVTTPHCRLFLDAHVRECQHPLLATVHMMDEIISKSTSSSSSSSSSIHSFPSFPPPPSSDITVNWGTEILLFSSGMETTKQH